MGYQYKNKASGMLLPPMPEYEKPKPYLAYPVSGQQGLGMKPKKS